MAAITSLQTLPNNNYVYIPFGAVGLSTGATLAAGVASYIVFTLPFAAYVTSITIYKGAGTSAGTLTAGYTTDMTGATALTTSNFGDSAVNDAASSTLRLPIAVSGATRTDPLGLTLTDDRPLLLPAGAGVGFVASSAVVATSKVVGVAITWRAPN
jgi:hypothetical protein